MRLSTIVAAAMLLMLTAAVPARACGGVSLHSAQITADLSAAAKKKMVKKAKKPKVKVEYMRAAPM
jgi:hypothetical protein